MVRPLPIGQLPPHRSCVKGAFDSGNRCQETAGRVETARHHRVARALRPRSLGGLALLWQHLKYTVNAKGLNEAVGCYSMQSYGGLKCQS